MKRDRLLSLLGLAAKAGQVQSGEFMVEKTVKARKGSLVIVATDTSDASKKSYRDMCKFYHTPIIEYSTKEILGSAIGKQMRASVVVTQEGFAKSILDLWKELSKDAEVNK